ncbi:patatin-like phospholipase family protein [bacterium]|nr:patatin-like phospholipase family protein [bacterium]
MTNPLKYTCLFGGGAIRGLAYVGTIRALEELGIEYDIIGGSSVGSIIAALVASGYKSYEIENLFMKVNFDLFKDIHLGIGKPLALSRGEIFLDWLNELLKNKIQVERGKNVTFKDIEKNLVIITTDLTKFSSQEFSDFETPDFEVAKAIKISSSMPGLMAPFEYKGSYLVDGDLQKASPMWRLSQNLKKSESRILEFRLEGDFNKNEKNPISFINTIYSCVTDVATEFVTEIYGQNDRYDCISINTGDVFFADFNLNKDARRKLINLGYEQTIKYFKNTLAEKKQKLVEIYSQLIKYLKHARKGLKSNNVEEVQFWFGDIFILLCEEKELVDPNIYEQLHELKENLKHNTSKLFFFHNVFKHTKDLENLFDNVLKKLENRTAELKLYLHLIKDFNPDQSDV